MSSLPTQPRGDTDFGWRFLTPLLLGSALNPINSSVIATALIPIGKAFGVSPAQTGLLVSTLYLASAVAPPPLGRLADRFGGKRVFLSGIILVLAGGLVGSFGGDISTLVVSRILIGIGTSAAYPTAMVLISARASRAGIDPPARSWARWRSPGRSPRPWACPWAECLGQTSRRAARTGRGDRPVRHSAVRQHDHRPAGVPDVAAASGLDRARRHPGPRRGSAVLGTARGPPSSTSAP
jgi:hypothetical protein